MVIGPSGVKLELERLGATVAGSLDRPRVVDGETLSAAAAWLASATWPAGTTYCGSVGHRSVWMVELRRLNKIWRRDAVPLRLGRIGMADGGNYSIWIDLEETLGDPDVYVVDHEDDSLGRGIALSVFLSALSAERGIDAAAAVDGGTEVATRTTALFVALSARAPIAEVRSLAELGIDVGARNAEGFGLLHVAAWFRQREAIALLLALGADVTLRGTTQACIQMGYGLVGEGGTPLHALLAPTSVRMVDPERVAIAHALLAAGAAVDARTALDTTPLHYAVARYHVDCLQILVHAGADVNAPTRDPELGFGFRSARPLHLAASVAEVDALELLLGAGADPDLPDEQGITPLHEAVRARRPSNVLRLLAAGADRDAELGEPLEPWLHGRKHAKGMTAMSIASDPETRRLLVEAGAEPR